MGCSEVAIRYFSSAPSMTYVSQNILQKTYFVKLIVKVFQLCSLCHDIFIHEERCLNRCITTFGEKVKTVLYECKVQSKTVVCEKIATMTNDFDTTWFLFVSTYSVENFMVGEYIVSFHRRCSIRVPSLK